MWSWNCIRRGSGTVSGVALEMCPVCGPGTVSGVALELCPVCGPGTVSGVALELCPVWLWNCVRGTLTPHSCGAASDAPPDDHEDEEPPGGEATLRRRHSTAGRQEQEAAAGPAALTPAHRGRSLSDGDTISAAGGDDPRADGGPVPPPRRRQRFRKTTQPRPVSYGLPPTPKVLMGACFSKELMPRNRFLELLQNLHLADNSNISKDRYYKGADVVLGLLNKCAVPPGHAIFFDNLFTSLELLDVLSDMGLGGCGTVRENRLGGAPFSDKKVLEKKQRGTMEWLSDGDNLVVRWNDNRVVTVATNYDSTEVCGVRILGKSPISIFNIYRPPIRRSPTDDREDNFDPAALPSDEDAIILGDLNAHHPLWDSGCDTADDVGNRVADWLDSVGWSPLNSGEPTHSSYRSGGSSAPDVAVCSRALARRSTWRVGPDLGSDHLPMLVSIRTTPRPEPSTRKPQWSFGKADWVAFKADCEATLLRAEPLHATAQELTTRFTEAIMSASRKYIPRGARKVVKPWALDPELQQAVAERREARRALRPGDPATRDRWVAAKRRAAETEKRVSQAHFRNFVETTLNKPASLGRVTKILKKWEGASDEHRPGQAMTEGDRLLVTDSEKAEAFNATYAHVSRQVRSAKVDRAAKRRLRELQSPQCKECGNHRTGCCAPFSESELSHQLQRLHRRKAPGPDGVCNEHLTHLGPVARRALLRAINASWLESSVPREWRQARIIPIPKAGKDKQRIASYRPIALTSHLSKLVERLILARLRYLVDRDSLVPPEQVGFRERRSVEDSIGRLVQQVQDGWNAPKSRGKNPPDGTCAQKYVLLAFDFARAYDTVDHRLLRVRLMELGIPRCFYAWTWQYLRDRRARVEFQSATSGERVYRAGLPQGSVLSPALFLLWAAPLAAELQKTPGTTAFLYADDTAALCSGNNIEVAKLRAQQAADALVKWARASKMVVAGQKTQALVLSQWARDAVNCSVQVAGETVVAGDQLKLLGITLDRLLHFGAHCRSLRQRVRPRTNQLRLLTGREWGLEERQLRIVASGYIRGALEHAAAAWLPAASPSHIMLLEREMREAARVVTGCPRSTPAHAVMAEAGLAPVAERRTALAARLLAKAQGLG
ncbi:putative RNA-directed DNA polymerase from transposon BS [Amphibalanus amphitrite]|uniref:Putative RNA-directed DNA polymerase from transposon BS n=1 Tax=Amphibalanus amphitrite TaxID=1232801 RepID=A0A6A4UYW8_AMPAM|nr:putative RNA-directed DNA polymerase from transposon BS [Amphibalanus amphitrite]